MRTATAVTVACRHSFGEHAFAITLYMMINLTDLEAICFLLDILQVNLFEIV